MHVTNKCAKLLIRDIYFFKKKLNAFQITLYTKKPRM